MPVYNVEPAGNSTFHLVVLEVLLPSDAADYGVPFDPGKLRLAVEAHQRVQCSLLGLCV